MWVIYRPEIEWIWHFVAFWQVNEMHWICSSETNEVGLRPLVRPGASPSRHRQAFNSYVAPPLSLVFLRFGWLHLSKAIVLNFIPPDCYISLVGSYSYVIYYCLGPLLPTSRPSAHLVSFSTHQWRPPACRQVPVHHHCPVARPPPIGRESSRVF